MCKHSDIEERRARDLARWHRRSAEREAQGLCQGCGKAEPAPGRTRCEPCLEKRRAADRERHHRRTAERLAAGMCPRCGKREPEPGLANCSPCNERQTAASRARDSRLRAEGRPTRDPERANAYQRERKRRLHAGRAAAGICTRCGRAQALSGGSACEPCAEKRRAHDRVRHARAKAQGLAYGGRDPETKRQAGRKHSRKRSEARKAAGLCIRCGKVPAAPDRSMCEPCRENRRQARRERYGRRRAAGQCIRCGIPSPGGKTYCASCAMTNGWGRRDPAEKREEARQRYAERRARGDCTTCGNPANGAAECRACRAAAKERYDARRAAGLCVRCQAPTFDGAACCAPCAVAKAETRGDREAEYAASRQQYAERRAKGQCVRCGARSPGVARCDPCARRHAESSGTWRGIPVWDPTWTVVELATGHEHGPFDRESDVALCLAFERLSRDEVEVVCDASPMATLTAWPD